MSFSITLRFAFFPTPLTERQEKKSIKFMQVVFVELNLLQPI